MSQKKWKWFYDKKDSCENNSAQPTSKVTVVDTTQSSDDDVMTWLTNLDLDSCVDS